MIDVKINYESKRKKENFTKIVKNSKSNNVSQRSKEIYRTPMQIIKKVQNQTQSINRTSEQKLSYSSGSRHSAVNFKTMDDYN